MWLQYIVFASLFVPSYFFCSKPCEHSQALGMEGGWIPDSSLQASSQLNIHHRPQLARLYNVRHGRDAGGWSAKTNDGQQWIKIDLGATKLVTEVLTQGRQDAKEWVKKFTVGYGEDGEHYKMYRDGLSFVKDFSANFDNNKIVKNKFNPPIRARFIRIFPCKWHGHISMRIGFRGSPACEHSQALGMEGGWIPDTSFQASSQLNIHHRPQLARLYNVRHGRDAGGWSAKTNDGQQWIKVDLGATKLVTEVLTQGRQDAKEWVKKFTVGYGEDGEHYKMYRDGLSFVKDFSANFDNNKIVKNKFNPPIRARFIRIFPCKWHRRISMRIGFRGSPGTQQKLKRYPRTIDMGFLIAGSRQVGRANFALQKSFVRSVSNMFEVSLHGSHVGLVTYSSRASVEMRFSSFLSNLAVQQRISRIPFPDEEGQRIDLGLDAARKLFNGPEYISRFLLVVVSGIKNRRRALKMIKEMQAMEKQRIKVYVVVIGTTFVAGLKKLLGYGNGKVFYLPSFKSLLTHQKDIAHQICQVNELDPIKIIRR